MDIVKSTSHIIKLIYAKRRGDDVAAELVKATCEYFDARKNDHLTINDARFLRYIASEAGVPQYYFMLNNFNNGLADRESDIHLETVPVLIQESSLYTADDIQLHKYQMEVLSMFNHSGRNRFFLSASTSFGKTFLVFEIIRKMQYDNVCLIFPTIALLSENLQKIYTKSEYLWIKDKYSIHTLSDADAQMHNNLLIFTPERYLSFLDKHGDFQIDFFFVDEVYKIDNEFIVDNEHKENERDVAYRICTHIGISKSRDCLLAGPYININTDKSESSIVRFLSWANMSFLDYNKVEVVGKQEYDIKSKKNIRLYDDETSISLSYTGKMERLKEQDRLRIACKAV